MSKIVPALGAGATSAAHEVAGIDVTAIGRGADKWEGICSCPETGKLYAAPSCSPRMLVVDPASKRLTHIDVSSVAVGS